MATIWGEQIGLRPFNEPLTEDEVARLYQWSSDEEVLRLSGGTPTDLTLEEFHARLRSERTSATDQRCMFFIVKRLPDANFMGRPTPRGELIGRVGCFALDWDKREGELGIVIGERAEWNKGYGREAVTLLLRHLFTTTSLERINLFTFVDNMRAQRSFAASGFRRLGRARRFSPDLGEYDGYEMEITRGEFLERKE
jgi:RimJ/RimL family protein N-acetyltransferase